jgi:hypothetical protein
LEYKYNLIIFIQKIFSIALSYKNLPPPTQMGRGQGERA